MTLQNGLVHKGRAYLWTDSLAVDAEGSQCLVSKAIVGLNWPWAAIYSGLMLTGDPYRVARRLGEAVPKSAPQLVNACREVLKRELEEGRRGRLLVAHAFGGAPARMFLMGNHPSLLPPQARAYDVQETVQHANSPADARWNARFIAEDFEPIDMRGFIAEQIKHPFDNPSGFPCQYGGELIEVRVTPKGVRPKQVCELGIPPRGVVSLESVG